MICTLVAATVPVVSALPCAVTHFPICSDFAVVDASVVILVAEPIVTDRLLVDVLPELRCRAATTMVEPETETTLPEAMAPARP